jgi:glycerol kinase
MPLILAIDQGTTGSRALLVDEEGVIRSEAYQPLPQIYPHPGWVEHDPLEIWEDAQTVIGKVMSSASPSDVAAVGITNQRETTLIWERATGVPIHNAIVWQCRRTTAMCERLKSDGLSDEVQRRTGLVIDPYFSATKIRWLLDHVPNAQHRAERGELAFGTIDSWLIYRLTGGTVHATDPTNASRTMLYNIHEQQWDDTLLDALNVPRALLPEVRHSTAHFGEVVSNSKLSIFGVAGDQQAALFGQAGFNAGGAKNTYGTGCFALLNTGTVANLSQNGLLTTIVCDARGKPAYALEGSVFIAGAVIQWLRDEMRFIANSAESEALARSVPDSGGVVVVPAFTGLGAPHWKPDARGAMFGITRGTTPAHIVRAALESIAFQTMDVMEAMKSDSGVTLDLLRVDGGASRNNFLMQFQADVLGVPVDRAQQLETTALGAAFLAGLGAGVFKNADALQRARHSDRVFEPQMGDDERASLRQRWRDAVRRVT